MALQVVHAAMHFLRVIRHRKKVIVASMLVTGLLGAIYFASAKRVYQSDAQLLVIPRGSDTSPTGVAAEAGSQGLMPTLERLITSAIVLDDTLDRLEKLPQEARVDFAHSPRDEWPKILQGNLSAYTIRRTNLIEINYRSSQPEAAAAVVNAVIASYIDFIDEHHRDVTAEIVTSLNDDLYELEERRQDKELELRNLRSRVNDLGLPPEALHPDLKEVLDLSEKVVEIQEERVSLEASLSAVRSAVQRGTDMRQHLLALEPFIGREVIIGALGMTEEDARAISSVELEVADERAQLNALAEHLGPAHPEVRKLQESIRSGEVFLANYHQRVGERVAGAQSDSLGAMLIAMLQEELSKTWEHENLQRAQYELAHTRAVALNNELSELTIVKHDLELLDKWYDVLVTRISEVHISEDRADVQVAVTSDPTVEDRAVSPRLSIVAMLCILVGLGGGASIVYVLDVLDDRFRSPEDIRDQLGVPLLSMVRKMSPNDCVGIQAIQMHVDPESVETEAFRTLRTTLTFSEQESDRLVVSSSEPGDGKTTVLANLGVAFANAGKRTLLIDADMRRPGLTRTFGLRGLPGLSDLLRHNDPVAEMGASLIVGSGAENLDILPCGLRISDPSELLSGQRIVDLIAWTETVYDQILVDSPPILAASDAALLGRVTDGVLIVVQPDKNHRRSVLRAVDSLLSIGTPVLGVVANLVSVDEKGYYGSGYGYGYGYTSYGADDDIDIQPADIVDAGANPSTIEDTNSSEIAAQKGLTVPRRAA